jgi:hypothetical protein
VALVGGLRVLQDPSLPGCLGLQFGISPAAQRGSNPAVFGASWLRRFDLDFDMPWVSRFPLAKWTLWTRQKKEWHPVRCAWPGVPGQSLLVPLVHVAEDGDLGLFTGTLMGPLRSCRCVYFKIFVQKRSSPSRGKPALANDKRAFLACWKLFGPGAMITTRGVHQGVSWSAFASPKKFPTWLPAFSW